jgi:GMP synthase-like glutamine amidotransferase
VSAYIAVIDPAYHRPELECLNQFSAWSDLPLSYHLPKILGTHTLHRLASKPKAVIVLGSASSVNDGEAWQKQMNDWLLPLMKSGIPTIGLCYGHQLICSLFGAKIGYVTPNKDKLRGVRQVRLNKNSLWGQATSGNLVVTHCEAVETCPDGFEVAGTSPEVAIDVVAHKELPIWGFQSHPEATPYFLKREKGDSVISSEDLELGHRIMKAFFKLAASRPE